MKRNPHLVASVCRASDSENPRGSGVFFHVGGKPPAARKPSAPDMKTDSRPLRVAAVLAAACFFACNALAGEEPLPVHRQPFHIIVARDSTPQTASATKTIAIHSKIAEVFQDSPVVWDPSEHLAEASLVCDVTGDKLPVGTNKQSPVYIEWTRHKLRKDEPGTLTVRVTDPKSIKPGVYRGTLWTIFRNDGEAMNRSLKVTWDIVLEARGRRLVGVEFQRKKAGKPLRVGFPAGVVVTLNAVGCEAGQGRLKLDWWSAVEQRRRALEVDVPLKRPVDPQVHFRANVDQGCHPQWLDCPVWTEVRPVEGKGPAAATEAGQVYEVLVVAPSCFLPGTMEAEVEWQQADVAATSEPLKTSTGEEPVLPGILVHPSLAFVGEPVSVLVRTERDHGPVVPLVLSGPGGQNILQLERRREAFPGSSDRLQEYAARFYPEVMGSCQITWSENAALQEDLGEPAEFHVCLGAQSSLAGDLEVFASAPPFWVTDKSGWGVILPEVFLFWHDPQFLREAELEDLATLRRAGDRLVMSDPEAEPNVQFWRHDERAWRSPDAAAAEAAPPGAEGEPPKDDADSSRWKLAPDEERALGLDMQVDLVRDAPPDDPRHRTGRYEFVQRMMLHARDTRGNPVVRIVELPVPLLVSTDWQYYRWIIGGLVGVGFLVLFGWYCYRINAGPRRKPVVPIELDEQLGGTPASGGFFSSPPPRRREPQGTPERTPPPPPATPDEPPATPEVGPSQEPPPESSAGGSWWDQA